MDPNFILGIVALIVTIFFALPAYRDSQKTKIFFFQKQKIKLYTDLVKNIPDLDITYKGNKIQKSMFLLSGVFICSGNNDIVKDDVHKGIIIKINDDDGIWETIKIPKKTDDLEIFDAYTAQSLVLDFTLFKDKDYFIIEALGQAEKLSLSFSHRISNIPKIYQATAGIEKSIKSTLYAYLIGLLIISATFYFVIPAIHSVYSLKPTYFNNNKQAIETKPEDFFDKYIKTDSSFYQIKDTSRNSSKDTLDPLGMKPFFDSIQEHIKIDRSNAMIDHFSTIYHDKKDSIAEVAAKEASSLVLLTGGETKPYRLDSNYLISFHHPLDWYNLILLYPIFMLIFFLYKLVQLVFQYFLYRKVAGLASKLLEL